MSTDPKPGRRRSTTSASVCAVVALLLPVTGCSLVTPATEAECEAAMDQMLRVLAREEAGGGVTGRLLEIGADGLFRASGHRDEFIRGCVSKWSSYKARCFMGASTKAEAKRCE